MLREGGAEEVMEKSSTTVEDTSPSSSSSPPVLRRRESYRALGSLSPRSDTSGGVTFSCEPPLEEEQHHFLDACHLCRRPLGRARDIFMYRGDTPFCSEDCRLEQMEQDEAREEEEAGYRRSMKRNRRSGHRARGPAAGAAEADTIRARAAEAAIPG